MCRKGLLVLIFFLPFFVFSESDKKNKVDLIEKTYSFRLKELTRIYGYKNNQLIGYGIVIGLKGTGDSKLQTNRKILQQILENFRIHTNLNNFEPKNVASVLVTAEIPPFAKKGDRITCYVSSIGDAKSIDGGILIQTPLYAANGNVYAVAQGKIVSYEKSNQFFKKQTNGVIPLGAIVERDLQEQKILNQIYLQLIHFDLETLQIIYLQLKQHFSDLDIQIEGGGIRIRFPNNNMMERISDVLNMKVQVPIKPKIIIDQKAKTIIVVGNISVKPFVVSRVWKPDRYEKIQKEAFQGIYIRSPGNEAISKTTIAIHSTHIQDLVKELNRYHFTIEDIISIFQSLIETGLIKAELIIR